MEKLLITFLLLSNDLKLCKNSLFCCNGYSHAIFTSRRTKKSIYKRKKEHKSANDPFIADLLLFYELIYINSIKNRFSNKKLGIVLEVTLIPNLEINIVSKFQASVLKNYKVREGGLKLAPPNA